MGAKATEHNLVWRTSVVTCLAIAAFCGCDRTPHTNPSVDLEEVSTPLSVFALDVGNVVNTDGSVPPMTRFAPTDKIVASIRTRGNGKNSVLDAQLIFQDGQEYGARQESVSTESPLTTNLEFARQAPWPIGRYSVDVSLNGKPSVRQEIEVRDSGR